ncbi:hypothetical protein [Spongiactinospora sp. TRM90649]|uniref:hypothetical protein n=1 Tax=Spongiactinospora sp. TRM90649 TaxID=3031114 RepID=UPI0023FA1103|nr:hypothetical protein [Spongiactinospora sp. TRM90649]MDF5754291.1 hypothetical protein [Spongiactinospora sp. TRM90649]
MRSSLTTGAGVRRLFVAAGQAPRCTTPSRGGSARRTYLTLWGDPDRRLRVGDPRGRSLHVSCGAALFNLRLALRVAGWLPDVLTLPGKDPWLLAALRPAARGPAGTGNPSI